MEPSPPAALAPFAAAELVPLRDTPPDRLPAAVYLASLAAGSRRTMRGALDTIARLLTGGALDAGTLDWTLIQYPHAAAIRAALADRYSAATANKMLSALKGTMRECWRLGSISAEEYHRIADLKGVRGSRLPRGRALDAGELHALFAACRADLSPAGPRDAAVLALLYGCGLRRSEVVALDRADLGADGAVTIRAAKGNKDRQAFLAVGGQRALAAWLTHRGDAAGPLFYSVNKGGELVPRRLSDQAVRVIVEKRRGAAGVGDFSPHDLRRTAISDLLDAGADIATVQRLVGHANPATTSRYDRRGERALRGAGSLLHVPYAPAAG